jgi:hypothetical protein
MQNLVSAAAAPISTGELNDLDHQVEAIFDRADDLMINQKKYAEAVSQRPAPSNYFACLDSSLPGDREAGPRKYRRPQLSRLVPKTAKEYCYEPRDLPAVLKIVPTGARS